MLAVSTIITGMGMTGVLLLMGSERDSEALSLAAVTMGGCALLVAYARMLDCLNAPAGGDGPVGPPPTSTSLSSSSSHGDCSQYVIEVRPPAPSDPLKGAPGAARDSVGEDDDDDARDVCVICLDALHHSGRANVKMASCACTEPKMVMHRRCVREWLRHRMVCPVCRHALAEAPPLLLPRQHPPPPPGVLDQGLSAGAGAPPRVP